MTDNKSNKSKPWWESAALSIAAVFVPLVVSYVGHRYTNTIKNREVDAEFVDLAIGILQAEPIEENQALRSWAIEVIDTYSEIKMDQPTKDSLQQERLIKYANYELVNPAKNNSNPADNSLFQPAPSPSNAAETPEVPEILRTPQQTP